MLTDVEIIKEANQLVGDLHGLAPTDTDKYVTVNFEINRHQVTHQLIVHYKNDRTCFPARWVPVKIIR